MNAQNIAVKLLEHDDDYELTPRQMLRLATSPSCIHCRGWDTRPCVIQGYRDLDPKSVKYGYRCNTCNQIWTVGGRYDNGFHPARYCDVWRNRNLKEDLDNDDFDPRAATQGIVAKIQDISGVVEPIGYVFRAHGDYPLRLNWRKPVGYLEDRLGKNHPIFIDIEGQEHGDRQNVYIALVDLDGSAFGNNYWDLTLPAYLTHFLEKLEAEVGKRNTMEEFQNLRYDLREKGILSDRG